MSDEQYRVALMDHMVFQPKGVSWVTEVDIACHNDKQYMRKTYQSTMDLAKELHLDADVFIDKCSSPKEKSKIDDNTSHKASDHVDQEEKQTLNNTLAGNSKVMGPKRTPGIPDSKVPPQKPPRKAHQSSLPMQGKETEIVTISSRLRTPDIQTHSLLATPDNPSIMEAGSRVSSFVPHTSTYRPYGHSRSKSESLKVDKGNLLETGFHDPLIAVSLGIVTDPKSLSMHVASPQSSANLATRSKSPSRYATTLKSPSKHVTSPKSLSRHATSPKSPSKHATSPRSPSKHATSPKSPFSIQKPKSPTFGSSQNIVRGEGYTQQDVPSKTSISQAIATGSSMENSDKQAISHHPAILPQSQMEDDQREKHSDTDGSGKASKGQYNEMLRELSAHRIMSAQGCLKTVNDNNTEEVGAIASNTEFRKQISENADSGDGRVEEYLLQKPGQEGFFKLSDSSLQNISQGENTPTEVVVGRPVLSLRKKSLTQVRKSSFISQDEVGSILEDKSLSSITRSTPLKEDSPVLDGIADILSHHFIHDKGWEIQSEQDESSFNDDAENTSPTLHFQFVSSGYSREHKRSQDSEKVVLPFVNLDVFSNFQHTLKKKS